MNLTLSFDKTTISKSFSLLGVRSHQCVRIHFLKLHIEKKKDTAKSNVFFGGPEEIRTLDFYNANVALSQLSYRPVNLIIITRGG